MPKARSTAGRRRGISRIDQPSTRTHGYFVRVGYYLRPNGSYGPRHTAFFGDVSHGGKRGALRAAEGWLRRLESSQRKRRRPQKARPSTRRARAR